MDQIQRKRSRVLFKKELSESPALLLFPSIIILALITLPPFFYSLYLSVIDKNLTAPYLPIHFVGLKNYINLFSDARAINGLKVTVIYVTGVIVAEFLLGLGIAALIDTYFRKHTWLLTLIIVPMTFPRIVSALLWRIMYNPLIGVGNYLVSLVGLPGFDWLGNPTMALFSVMLVDIWQWTPFIILLLLAGYETLPQSPYEAAIVDGASGWQMFWYITIPLLMPIIVVSVIFRTIDALRTFDTIFTLTGGGPGIATETIDIFAYHIGIVEGGNISVASAASVLVLVFTIIVATFAFKRVKQWDEG